jgi:hypothetical protein
MSRYQSTKFDELLKKLIRMGLTKTEISKLEKTFEVPVFREKFEDPIVAQKLLNSFEVPVFRKRFFEDPIVAIEKLSR